MPSLASPLPEVPPVPPAGRPDFEKIYVAHFAFVWRNLRRLGVPAAQLDDATQEVFLVVYRRLSEFEARSTMTTWLFGIVLRVASGVRRSAARRPTEPLGEEPVDTSAAPEALTEAARAAELVRRLLASVPEERRTVFVLAELEQLTAPEIAEALGVKLNTVYSRLRLGRRDFEAALARHQSWRPR